MKLDKLDYAVLSIMRKNCRITYKELAKEVDSNINTVASRIKRLEKNEYILGYNANIDYQRIGFETSALLKLVIDEAKSLDSSQLADILSMPETVMVGGITGSYDLNVILQTKNFEELIEKIGEVGKNEHIVDMKSDFIVKEYKISDEFNPFVSSFKKNHVHRNRKKRIDQLDLGILRELRCGANTPLRVLSDKLGSPISTIKERTDRMVYEGIIQGFVARLNFPKLGYWGFENIAIKLDSEYINNPQVAEGLMDIPDITNLIRTLGLYDFHVCLLTKGVDHGVELLKKISSVPGVVKAEPRIGLAIYKSRDEFNPLSKFKMDHELESDAN
jgi:DNA-binding Lrp family transcriptional regulator